MAGPGSGDGSRELRPKRRDSPIIVGRFTSCSSWPSLRLHPSGAGDDRDGCWRLLMVLDCSSTVGWGTTLRQVAGDLCVFGVLACPIEEGFGLTGIIAGARSSGIDIHSHAPAVLEIAREGIL